MRDDLGRLAERFRATLRAEEEARRQREEADRARREAARRARGQLLADLVGFAETVGIDVARDGEAMTWRWRDRVVTFRPQGTEDGVEVAWTERTARTGRLYQESRLEDRWVLTMGRGPSEDRVPLVEAGMVRLLVEGLGLPAPTVQASPPSSESEDGPSVVGAGRRRM